MFKKKWIGFNNQKFNKFINELLPYYFYNVTLDLRAPAKCDCEYITFP